ncbi:MAG TPA: MmgE/PrpD family protein [Burkholderiales bacterium]|nr:MmgE/PrpD family protein [Burkholderiales bacterium]
MPENPTQIAVTQRLSEFVAACSWDAIPGQVRHEAIRSLVNFFAVSLAGCNDPTIAKAARVLGRFRAGEQATLIGRGERTDLLNAAALNAMSANVFDFDDTHIPTVMHPTAPVAAALFALAESTPVSGRQFLHAFVLGVEIECRIGKAISPGHYSRGWHITSTCGVFGAAAAAGKVLGLDAQHLAWSFGSAANQACGLVETLGTMAKSMSVGNAARNGLLSALLAREGFDGPAQPLEGVRGFLNVTGERPDLAGLAGGLGDTWELLSNTYKPYPCGVVLNPVIEACLELHANRGLDIASIDSIEITGHPLLRQRTDRPAVRTGRESQVSAQHAAGVVLTTGLAGLEQFSDAAVAQQAVRDLGSKVCFVDDDSFSLDAARVAVKRADKPALSAWVESASGSLKRPLTDRALEHKLQTLCAYGRSGCEPGPLIDALWALEASDDVRAILRLAAGKWKG